MRSLLLIALAAAAPACRFDGPGVSPAADAAVDAALPVAPEVQFVAVTAPATIYPGLYGFEVVAVLRNELAVPVTDVRATLELRDASGDRTASFRWRDRDARDGSDTPQPTTVTPGAEVTLRFRVDALASAVGTGPITVTAAATLEAGGARYTAAQLAAPPSMQFVAGNAPIVVSTLDDESNNNGAISLREAIGLANQAAGRDRIVFSPAVFPAGQPRTLTLQTSRGQLPDVTGDLVIDAGAAAITLTVPGDWEGSERYGLRLGSGTLLVHGLTFRDLGLGYPYEDVSRDNCGTGNTRIGGAIHVTGGTLILDGNRFEDPGVRERNCYAASVRITGGSDHRILESTWTDQVMDSIHVNAHTREISDNLMIGGTNLDRVDECIFVAGQGGQDLWIVGNVCVDQEYSAVAANGTDSGTLYVVNNTFARNGRTSLGAVRRDGSSPRAIVLRNNAYHSNMPAAIVTNGDGTGFTASHEWTFGGTYCSSCAAAAIEASTMVADGDTGFATPTGSTRAALTPKAGSMLVDRGQDLVDRNGREPGRFRGARVDLGAVETTP